MVVYVVYRRYMGQKKKFFSGKFKTKADAMRHVNKWRRAAPGEYEFQIQSTTEDELFDEDLFGSGDD